MRNFSMFPRLTVGFIVVLVLCLPAALLAQGPPGAPPAGPPSRPPGGPPPPPPVATVQVDCAAGDSINAALANPARELTVEIHGVCNEDVEIRRDRVTLIGATSPAADGVRAVDTTDDLGAAVLVRDARDVRIENLSLGGGAFVGLFASNAQALQVIGCRLEGNAFRGANYFGDSFGNIEDTVITGNGTAADPAVSFQGRGIQVSGGGVSCLRCTITDNGPPGTDLGVYALRGANVTLRESTVSGLIAVATDFAGHLTVVDSTLTGVLNPSGVPSEGIGYAAYADTNSRIQIVRSTVANSLAVDNKSQLLLSRVTQAVNDSLDQNWAAQQSLLEALNLSTLVGATRLFSFSNGVFRGETSLGDLSCEPGSDALCQGAVSRTGSDCSLCPCTDGDGDGFFAEEGCGTAFDCNDGDAAIHPGAPEVCGDGGDNNCNGDTDEGCP